MEQSCPPIEQPGTPKRRRNTPLTRDDRLRIHTLWKAGHKQQWIADHLGFKLRQVTYVLSGPVTPRKKTGRPKKRPASEDEVQELRDGLQDLNNRLFELQQGAQGPINGQKSIKHGPENFDGKAQGINNGLQHVEHQPQSFQQVPQQVYYGHHLPGHISQVPQQVHHHGLPGQGHQVPQYPHQGLPQNLQQSPQHIHQAPQYNHPAPHPIHNILHQIYQAPQQIHQSSQNVPQASQHMPHGPSRNVVPEPQNIPRAQELPKQIPGPQQPQQHVVPEPKKTPEVQEPQISGDEELRDTANEMQSKVVDKELEKKSVDQDREHAVQEPQKTDQESQDSPKSQGHQEPKHAGNESQNSGIEGEK